MTEINKESEHSEPLSGQHPIASEGAAENSPEDEFLRFRSSKRKPLLLQIVLASFALILLSGIWSGYSFLSNLGVFSLDTTRIEAISNFEFKDNTKVFDRDGNLIGEFFEEYQIYTPFEQIPKELINAIIAIEDKRFFEHKGSDPKAIARAVFARVRGQKTNQGASTITQQVVRHLFLNNDRTIERKILEIAWAFHLARKMSKQKILELYCNIMFLGNGAYGVSAAAKKYFSKNLNELKPEQLALIAGLFQSPSRFNPIKNPKAAKARLLQVLDAMTKSGMITQSTRKTLAKSRLAYKPFKPSQAVVGDYFVDYINEQARELLKLRHLDGSGLRIYTTLDQKIQRIAEASVASHGSTLDKASGKNSSEGSVEAAILMTNPETGEILAMVGGRDYKKSQFNRAASSKRSPGSAFKPIVYATALQNGFKWSDVSLVSPVNFDNYKPKNHNGEYLTESTLFRAFYRSINSPTVELADAVGLKKILDKARDLGFQSPLKDELGTALGSSDATLSDMARVYGAFANGGNRVDLNSITRIEDQNNKVIYTAPALPSRTKHVLSESISYLITSGMRAVFRYGTGYSSNDLASFSAGKTGTSNQSTDNWFCGYTRDLVGIVWVGTDHYTPLYGNQTGGTLALPIWDSIIRQTYGSKKPLPFEIPANVLVKKIHPEKGILDVHGIEMPFLDSNQPKEGSEWQVTSSVSEMNGGRNVFRK